MANKNDLGEQFRDMGKQIEDGFRSLFGAAEQLFEETFDTAKPSHGTGNTAGCYAQVVPTPACFSMDMQSREGFIGLFILVGRPLSDFKLSIAEKTVTLEVEKARVLHTVDGDYTAHGIGFDPGTLTIKLPYRVDLIPVSKSYTDGTVRLVLKMAEPSGAAVEF